MENKCVVGNFEMSMLRDYIKEMGRTRGTKERDHLGDVDIKD
jgi:hypothetical protein